MAPEYKYSPMVNWDCEHIDSKALSCKKAEGGEALIEQKMRICLDCLVGLYYLSGKQNDELRAAYLASHSNLYFLRPNKA